MLAGRLVHSAWCVCVCMCVCVGMDARRPPGPRSVAPAANGSASTVQACFMLEHYCSNLFHARTLLFGPVSCLDTFVQTCFMLGHSVTKAEIQPPIKGTGSEKGLIGDVVGFIKVQ